MLKKVILIGLIFIGAKCAYSATNAYVTNQNGDSVSVVDLMHDQKLIDLPLPTLAGPTAAVSTPNGRYIISANYNGGWSGSISLIDTSNYKTRELRFGDLYSLKARGPAGIAISEDGKTVLVSSTGYWMSPNGVTSLVMVDLSELQKIDSDIETASLPFEETEIEGGGGDGIVFDSKRKLAYIAQYGFFDGALNFFPTNLVSILDFSKVIKLSDLSKVHVTQMSSARFIGPVELVLHDNTLYIANQGPILEGGGAKTVTVVKNIDKINLSQSFIDLDQISSTGIEVQDLVVTPWPTGMTFLDHKLYVTSFNEPQWGAAVITLIDHPDSNPQLLEMRNGIDESNDKFYDGLKGRSRIYHIRVTEDGKKIVVAGQPWYVHKEDPERSGSLYIIDHSVTENRLSGSVDLEGQRGKRVKKIEAGAGANGLTIAKDVPLNLELPKELQFTAKINTVTEGQKIIIKNNSQIVLHLLEASVDQDAFIIGKKTTCNSYLIAGESCEFEILFNPHTLSTFNGSLTLRTNADNSDKNGNLVVKLTGMSIDENGVNPLTDPGNTGSRGDSTFLPSVQGGGCSLGEEVSRIHSFFQTSIFLLISFIFVILRRQRVR